MWQHAKQLKSDERGVALATVAFLGVFLIMIVGVMVLRSTGNSNNTANDRSYEGAAFVAESGVDTALYELSLDLDYATVPASTDLSTRDKVLAVAEGLAADPANVISTPDGEFVIVKAVDGGTVYGVGASPSWDAPRRSTRVIAADVAAKGWSPEYAFVVGGDLKVDAKKDKKDVELLGNNIGVHANGKLELKDKNENNVWGCLTAYGDGAPGQIYSNGQPGCPPESAVEEVFIPEINPMNLHYLAQYEVCPDGINRYGPGAAGGGLLPPAKSGSAIGSPCTGDAVVIDLLLKDSDEGDKRVEFKGDTVEGVYFLYGRSAKMKKDKVDHVFHFTIIATKPNNDLSCSKFDGAGKKIDKEQYGDIEVDAHGDVFPHPDGAGYLIVTAGDVKLKTKHKKDGEIHGAVFSHEQVKLESEDVDLAEPEAPKGGMQGAVVAEAACDTKDSKVKKKSELKKGDILYNQGDFRSYDFGDLNGLQLSTMREL